MDHNMTHYMQLLSENQPWNLLIFMAVPVICAETLAISEFIILFSRNMTGTAKKINKVSGIFAGFYFLIIFVYLMINAVIPLSATGSWRGVIDVIAVGFYMLGIIPFMGLALLELKVIGREKSEDERLKMHAILVSVFLIVAHIAMIFGMLNPNIFAHSMM